MATTKNDIQIWLEEGKERGATHVVIVCDTFDYEDYPICVLPEQSVQDVVKQHDGTGMQKVMGVYNLDKDLKEQLNKSRNFEF